MTKYLLSLLFMVLAGIANAQNQNYYVCDCQTGAEPSCVAGSSANNGTSPATPKQTFAQLPNVNTRPAGTTINFCRGGSINWPSVVRLENPNTTKTNPMIFDAYTPPGGGTARPLLYSTGVNHGTGSGFEFGGYFDEVDDCGYTFRNLHLKGQGAHGTTPGSPTRGWLVWGVVCAVVFDNNEVEGFVFGWEESNGTAGGDPQLGVGFIWKNNYIHHNGMGMLGSRQNATIVGNTFERNNNDCTTECGFSHALYWGTGRGFSGDYSRSVLIEDNLFINNSMNVDGNCDGGSVTLHGRFDQVMIKRNRIETTSGFPTTACFGISANDGYQPEIEFIHRLLVEGNTIANVGNVGLKSNIGGEHLRAYNNKFIKTRVGGLMPSIEISLATEATASIEAGLNSDNADIAHNTWYVTVAAAGSAINRTHGVGHQVRNNLVYLGASATGNCFNPGAFSNYTSWNGNACIESGSGTWGSGIADLAAAQALGFDPNGVSTFPGFAVTPSTDNGWNLALSANSTGVSLTHPTRDVLGCSRASSPTRGAYEFNPTGPCSLLRTPSQY